MPINENKNLLYSLITDKRYKIDVYINNASDINYDEGTQLEIIGELRKTGKENYYKNLTIIILL